MHIIFVFSLPFGGKKMHTYFEAIYIMFKNVSFTL